MSLEYIVRPFESPGSHGRTVIPSTPSSGGGRATLTWGAKVAPNSIPKAKSIGVNVECCAEISTEKSRRDDEVKITAKDNEDNYITVRRATEVKLKKKEDDNCDDWLTNNSFASSGVKESFSGLSYLIHASDSSFMPAGSSAGECNQTLKLQPNTTAA